LVPLPDSQSSNSPLANPGDVDTSSACGEWRFHVSTAWLPFLAGYALLLVFAAGLKPLWLDEVLQLQATTAGSIKTVLLRVMDNPGGVPLGYVIQHWILEAFGSGLRILRLPSIVASVLALICLLQLAGDLGLRRRTLKILAVLWIVCPILFRYSVEGRPYMQGVLFALLACQFQLIALRPGASGGWTVLQTISLMLGIYSQAFAVLAPLGFSACLIWQRPSLRGAARASAAYGVAIISFVPWLVMAKLHWIGAPAPHFTGMAVDWHMALVVAKELIGDGWGAAIPAWLMGCAVALAILRMKVDRRQLPVLGAAVSGVLLALLADIVGGYFYANRQMLFAIPFVLMLLAVGVDLYWPRARAAIAVCCTVFLVFSVLKDVKHQLDASEDWARLTSTLRHTAEGGCVLFPVDDPLDKYLVFDPGARARLCPQTQLPARVVVPVHIYSEMPTVQAMRSDLASRGFSLSRREPVGSGSVEVFDRPGSRH
jgi:hypothetical protein